MGLFRSSRGATAESNVIELESHEGGDGPVGKSVTAIREDSVDKDATSSGEGETDAPARAAEDESKYPHGPKLWLLVLGLCLTIWVVALDNSIIATATLIIFEIGSVICAAATSSTMLIVGEELSLLLGDGYGNYEQLQPMYILTRRQCFWINLPFGAIGLVAVFFFFSNPERKHTNMTFREKVKQIDILGAFLLICAIVCLLLALQWGGTTYPWSNSKVWGCLLGFGLLISVFIALQATLPPRILVKQRTVLVSAAYSAFFAMGMYTHIFYLPFYFQAVKNTSAEGSGIRCIAYLVSNTIASVIVGGTITVIGVYAPFMWFGAAVFTVGAGMLYTLEVGSPAARWIGYQLLAGIGSGSAIQIPFIAVQVVLEEKDMPSGNAIAIFFNSLGGAISISIAQNIFANTLVKDIIKNAPGVNPAAVISAGATHVREVVSADQLAGVLMAYSNAVTSAFIVPIATSGLAFIVSLFIEWKSIKGKNIMGGGAA
ncbi:putative major facilitator superfamily transporter [Aureobasidium subglaciale]|nr:putative major facilitator superfamily transporter [Aureobasidium subglaciale]